MLVYFWTGSFFVRHCLGYLQFGFAYAIGGIITANHLGWGGLLAGGTRGKGEV